MTFIQCRVFFCHAIYTKEEREKNKPYLLGQLNCLLVPIYCISLFSIKYVRYRSTNHESQCCRNNPCKPNMNQVLLSLYKDTLQLTNSAYTT
jgi:hypothetical protein